MAIPFLVVPLLLSLTFSTTSEDTPAELVKKLGGHDPQAASKALLAVDPSDSLPLLVECLGSASPTHAWQAGNVVHRLELTQPRHKAWRKTVSGLLEIVLDGEVDEENRTVAVLSLRGLGKTAKPTFKDLAELLRTTEPPQLRLGASLFFANIGKDSVSILRKNLKGEGMMKMVWASTALGCMGRKGSSAGKTLAGLIMDEESFTAFLACRSNVFALEQVAGRKAIKKPFSKRQSSSRGKTWRGGFRGINFGGFVPRDCKLFFTHLSADMDIYVPKTLENSLPKKFKEPLNGKFMTLGDATQCLAEHLSLEVFKLHKVLVQGEIETWEDWTRQATPIVKLAEILDRLDSHVTPVRSK